MFLHTHRSLQSLPFRYHKMTDHDARKTLVHQYRRNIIRLRDILTGKSAGILRQLDKEMYEASRHQNFEHAANVRNQLQNLRFLLEKAVRSFLCILPMRIWGNESGKIKRNRFSQNFTLSILGSPVFPAWNALTFPTSPARQPPVLWWSL